MNNEFFIRVLVIATVVIIDVFLIKMVFVKPKVKKVKSPQVDFDSDMEFLLYLIAFKCSNAADIIVKTKTEFDGRLLGDDYVDHMTTDLSNEIIDFLSDDYKERLEKYFRPDNGSLKTYIVEMVFLEISKTAIKQNKKIMNSGD